MSSSRVLITAFEPYDDWEENASWLALVELTRELPREPKIVTRRYPVDFDQVRERLAKDLEANFDYALMLGQAPGIARIHLEAIGINVGGHSRLLPDQYQPLVEDGPIAYRSKLPLANWSRQIREAGIPCQVSHHAGTYLCNAQLYLAHHIIEQKKLNTRATFVHLPLATTQVFQSRQDLPSLPTSDAAFALRIILQQLTRQGWLF